MAAAHYSEDPYEATRQVVSSSSRPFIPRGRARGSRARARYNFDRTETQRFNKSKIVEADLSLALKNKLFPGIKDAQDAANKIESTQTFKAIQLTITTRQIGFGTVQIFMALRQFNNIPVIGNVYEMYRVNLAILEVKTIIVNRGVTALCLNDSDFEVPPPNENFVIAVKSLLNVPEPIANTVNAIGVVETNERKYVPKIGMNNTVRRGGLFIPQSEQVTYSNLRRVVLALANAHTPAQYRRRFYRNNPIPGAIWQNAPDDPILLNADEIMPDGYTLEDFITDMDNVKVKYSYMVRKAPKYFGEPIKYEVAGSKAMLASNKQETLRVIDRNVGEDLAEYQMRMKVDGNIESYWNLEKLNSKEMIDGTLSLLGEIPNTVELVYPVYLLRDERAACEISNTQYRATNTMKYT